MSKPEEDEYEGDQREMAEQILAYCDANGWSPEEARGAMLVAIMSGLGQTFGDGYYHVYSKDGHDIWLHETEPLVKLDMSEPPMARRGVPAAWLEQLSEVTDVALSILKADRATLGLSGKELKTF